MILIYKLRFTNYNLQILEEVDFDNKSSII